MKPELKAKELVEKIFKSIQGCCISDKSARHASYHAALIAVDEIINCLSGLRIQLETASGLPLKDYWIQVKQEIEKL